MTLVFAIFMLTPDKISDYLKSRSEDKCKILSNFKPDILWNTY